jgi:WD40 repeat protein
LAASQTFTELGGHCGNHFGKGVKRMNARCWGTLIGICLIDQIPASITFDGPKTEVMSIRLFNKGKMLATGGADKKVYIWDVVTRKVTKTLDLDWNVRVLAVSPNNQILAVGTFSSQVALYDLQKGNRLEPLRGHINSINSICFSKNGRTLYSACSDGIIKIWDLTNHKEIKTLRGHKGSVYSIAVSADGNKLVSASHDRTLILWDLEKLTKLALFEGHQGVLLSATFAPDGKTVVSGGLDKKLIVWDLEKKKATLTYTGEDPIRCLRFLPGRSELLLGSEDGRLVHFDLKNGKVLKRIQGHNGPVTSLEIQENGKTFYSSGFDKKIKEWSIEVLEGP